MKSSRQIEGTILCLACDSCAGKFSYFSIFGDSDTDTFGILSASSVAKNEVVIDQVIEDGGEYESKAQFISRLNKELSRNDLRISEIVRIVSTDGPYEGEDTRAFMIRYRPPQLFYSCIFCNNEASILSEIEPSEYISSGGVIILIGDLELRASREQNS